jgi:GntR family transcriptional repressor for pyruvate dehydrogenase complex
VGEGTSVALDGEKFLGKIVEWRLITEKHDIENLLEVRIALEGVAAAKAAAFAGEQDIALIDALIGRMKEAVDDAKRFAALDLEFHVALAKASGNALLFDLVSMIRGQLARGLSKVLHVPDALPLSLKEHIAIAEAIRRGNSAAAQKAMQAHLGDALKRYDDAMEKQMPVRRSAPRGAKSR